MEKDLFKIIETPNLVLRKITDEDAKDLYQNIYHDFNWFQYYYPVEF